MMRLSRWQLIGAVLSVAWVLGAAIYQRNADVENADNFAKFAYRVCTDSKALNHDADLTSCEQERKEKLAIFLEGSWGNAASIALIPIPVAWLAAFILINFGRAVIIGFRAIIPWSTMTLPKKVFVIFSGLATLLAILFSFTVVLNLYVERQIPVMLGARVMVTQLGNDFVQVRGTWTREGSNGEGSKLGFPLQTSQINCYRSDNRCFEARASVSGNVLMTELVEYEVESWSNTTIVFKNEGLCASEVFTIDRKTESINGVGRQLNTDNEYCKRFQLNENNESRWSYHLTNGFDVYWELRQKARPLPLRLIQTLFSN